jgi:hypothetical protein
MNKVILDTNILYSLVGISPSDKVQTNLGSSYELWTTTSALIEGIVKYRNDLSSVQLILKPIINEEIKLISIGYTPLETSTIKAIYNSSTLDQAANHISDVLTLKITKEAEFIRWLFVISVLGIFEVLKKTENYTFSISSKNKALMRLTAALVEGNEQFLLDYFEDKIREGYLSGDEQRVVLTAFNDMLLSYINIFHFNYCQVAVGVVRNNALDESEEAMTNLKQKLTEDQFYKKFKKHLENPIGIVSKKSAHSEIDSYIAHIKSGLSNDNNLTQHALDFLGRRLEKGFKDKSKIRKNDVFDFLQIFSLSLDGYKILTLDKAFIAMLKTVDEDSWNLIHSLGYD